MPGSLRNKLTVQEDSDTSKPLKACWLTTPSFACSTKVLTFQVGNHPGVLNPHPAVEMVPVRFVCAHPASMAVMPVYELAAGTPPCPLPQHHKQLVSVPEKCPPVLLFCLPSAGCLGRSGRGWTHSSVGVGRGSVEEPPLCMMEVSNSIPNLSMKGLGSGGCEGPPPETMECSYQAL